MSLIMLDSYAVIILTMRNSYLTREELFKEMKKLCNLKNVFSFSIKTQTSINWCRSAGYLGPCQTCQTSHYERVLHRSGVFHCSHEFMVEVEHGRGC